ncbi:MAG: DUF72 domain-containing protein [Chitinophagales bacterium]|nr:DUF72 domain-containing protein [Chitinophagales bacterium]
MQFGRLTDISTIDFSLPVDDVHNAGILASAAKQAAKVYVGCPVWADKGFIGKIYPKGTKADKYLYHYCQQFNSIEVNATAYQLPSREGIMKWKEVAPPGFKYCPKFPQFITHRKDIDKKDAGLDQFFSLMYELGDNLGPSLLQLPPHFGPRRLEELYRFLEIVPQDFSVAVEVRHPDWFSEANAKEEYFNMLQQLGRIAVISDVAGRRDVLHMRLTSPVAFIRFNGDNLVPSDYERTQAWAIRLAEWADAGLQQLYFFPHEPDKHKAADLSVYFLQEWNKLRGESLPYPNIGKNNGSLFA